jgi:hypothetical protein
VGFVWLDCLAAALLDDGGFLSGVTWVVYLDVLLYYFKVTSAYWDVYRSYVECLVLSSLNQNWNVLTNFSKIV